MIETFYAHLEFKNKNGAWSINLPFLCNKCGVCCTLNDFLTAGETKPNPEVDAKVKPLFEALGDRWEADEAKYDEYVAHTPCPFLVNKACSIYEFRPDGCRLFPKTAFGMLTEDCEPLIRFTKQRLALKKGRASKESYHFTGPTSGEHHKPAKFTEKQYQTCIVKLRQAGITADELSLFNCLNGKNRSQ
jgi:Fe-S-cluster containining protein